MSESISISSSVFGLELNSEIDQVLVFRTFLSDASWSGLESLYEINFSIFHMDHLGNFTFYFVACLMWFFYQSENVLLGVGWFLWPWSGHCQRIDFSEEVALTFYPNDPLLLPQIQPLCHKNSCKNCEILRCTRRGTKWWDWFVHRVIKMAWMYCNFLPPHASLLAFAAAA